MAESRQQGIRFSGCERVDFVDSGHCFLIWSSIMEGFIKGYLFCGSMKSSGYWSV